MVEMYVGVSSPWGQSLSEPPATGLWNLLDHRGLCGHVPSPFLLLHTPLCLVSCCVCTMLLFWFFFCVIFFL